MNTHGHEKVAEEAGLPLLEEAFSSGSHKPRLTAFYLGNWITDLTQVFDPVAIAGARNNIVKVVDDAFDTALNGIYYLDNKTLLPLSTLTDEGSIVRALKKKITDRISDFFDWMTAGSPDSSSPWLKVVQPGVLLKGYCKFVQPDRNGVYQMDLPSYIGVFEELFRQYYPYEHVDRPVHPTPRPVSTEYVQYDDRLSTGPRNSQNPQSSSPDLYWYLRDDIQIIAGRLTDLDLTWASRYLSASPPPDNDLDWNKGLAKLGRAVHGIEDFYAHSNFIEHAAKVMGDRYVPVFFEFSDKRRFIKRLKKYDYRSVPDDWTRNENEEYIVTGYFDFVDTMFSIAHILEEGVAGFAIHPVDGTRHLRVVWDYTVDPEKFDREIGNKVVADFLEIVTDPSKLSSDNKQNQVVQAIRKTVDETYLGDINKFIEALEKPSTPPSDLAVLFRAMPAFKDLQALVDSNQSSELSDAAGKILAAFLNFVRLLMMPIRIGEAAYSVYDAIKTVQEFMVSPLLWIEKEFAKQTALYLVNVSLFFGKEAFYEAKGLERIGCHSLIAKDHGSEVLYKEMKGCATAAQYYIVKTLLRWRDQGFSSRPSGEQWVDWLELLEYLTLHPQAGLFCAIEQEVSISKSHILTNSDKQKNFDQLLKDLASQYLPTTFLPTGVKFDERSILNANISLKIKKDKAFEVAETTLALLVAPTIAVPLRLRRIIIPYIRHKLMVCDPAAVDPRWYMIVMKDGWESIKTANPHVLKYHSSRAGAIEESQRADNLRKELEAVYRPT